MPVKNAQLTQALEILVSQPAVERCELPDTAILADRTLLPGFLDWRSAVQPEFDEAFAALIAVADQAQANRRTAAALRQASVDVAALRELMLAWWGGAAADACALVVSNFTAVLAAAADALDALSDFDAALLNRAIATRVAATRRLLAYQDQQTFVAWWDQARADLSADLRSWHDQRQTRVDALTAAAYQLSQVPSDELDVAAGDQP